MNTQRPVLVFDTNIIMDLWLTRDDSVPNLVGLSENHKIDIIVPEYVILEFRGTALRWCKDQIEPLNKMNNTANSWKRVGRFNIQDFSKDISTNISNIKNLLSNLEAEIDNVILNIKNTSKIWEHSRDIHYRGDLRYLSGKPPDGPIKGIKDCRIYETILDIAKHEKNNNRRKIFLCKDSDFNHPELINELHLLDFEFCDKPGPLFGELRSLPETPMHGPNDSF